MNKNTMTVEHMIDVAEACQACEDLQSKHAILHAAGQTEEELDTMWSKRDDIFWAHNFGGMTTRDAVYKGWAGGLAQNAHYYYRRLLAVYPEVEGKEPRTLMECAVHMLGSSIIEVADDGMSARGSWYTPGVIFSTLNPDQKKEGIWIWERYGNDFVKEGDAWKIWHIVEANDIVSEAGTAYGDGPVYLDYETDPVAVEFGTPTIPMITHDATFNWWDNYPAPPTPYDTWSDEISYGPEGYPEKTEYHFGAGEGGNY